MRRALWIAVDLITDLRSRRAAVWLTCGLFLWWPFQAALLDGLAARAPLGAAGGDLRGLLVLNASWPAMLMAGLIAETFLPRRLGRAIEPLLACPVTELEIAAALAAPVLAGAAISPLLTFPLNLLGYAVGAGRLPADPAGDLLLLTLGALAAGTWLSAATIDAAARATGQAAFLARALCGYAVVAALDVALVLLRLSGWSAAQPAVLLAATAAGSAAIVRVARTLDRETLLRRL